MVSVEEKARQNRAMAMRLVGGFTKERISESKLVYAKLDTNRNLVLKAQDGCLGLEDCRRRDGDQGIIELAIRRVAWFCGYEMEWDSESGVTFLRDTMQQIFSKVDREAGYSSDESWSEPFDPLRPRYFYGFTSMKLLQQVNYEAFHCLHDRWLRQREGSDWYDRDKNEILCALVSKVAHPAVMVD